MLAHLYNNATVEKCNEQLCYNCIARKLDGKEDINMIDSSTQARNIVDMLIICAENDVMVCYEDLIQVLKDKMESKKPAKKKENTESEERKKSNSSSLKLILDYLKSYPWFERGYISNEEKRVYLLYHMLSKGIISEFVVGFTDVDENKRIYEIVVTMEDHIEIDYFPIFPINE